MAASTLTLNKKYGDGSSSKMSATLWGTTGGNYIYTTKGGVGALPQDTAAYWIVDSNGNVVKQGNFLPKDGGLVDAGFSDATPIAGAPTYSTTSLPSVQKDANGYAPGDPHYNANAAATPTTQVAAESAGKTTVQAPTTSLQPGATGDSVKKLQDYLVSQGFMTQAQVNTGYGTYGPQTTAAVKAWQQANGVDNSTGPGYWGPRSIQAAAQPLASGAPGSTAGGGDPQLAQLLKSANLSPDQQAMAQHVYDLISTNDTAQAGKLMDAFKAATQYSDPYFKAQIGLVTDQLSRDLSSKEGDLAFKEQQLQNSLTDLTNNISASKDYLDFTHTQDLQKLAQSYQSDLENTRQDMASRGFTSSTVRSKAEDLLHTNNENLVESSNRQFNFQNTGYNNQLGAGQRDTAQQLDYYKQLAASGKIDLLRGAEAKVGSTALSGLGYKDLLGGIGGDIPRQQIQDANSFASNFVF